MTRPLESTFLPFALTFTLLACSSTDGPRSSSVPEGGGGAPVEDSAIPATEPEELLAHGWTIDPGVETFFCSYLTLAEELWVRRFHPLSPDGTHHVTLGFRDPGPEDGTVEAGDPAATPPCTGITLGDNLVYFSGLGTGDMELPEKVAV